MLTSLRHLSLAGNLWAMGQSGKCKCDECAWSYPDESDDSGDPDSDDPDSEDPDDDDPDAEVILEYCTESLDHLLCFKSCELLNIRPFPLNRHSNASWLGSWMGLTRLQHLPLRELHIGVKAPHPPCPADSKAFAFYKAAQEALVGAPDRLGMALMRGTRG